MLDKYKSYINDPDTIPQEYINDGLMFIKEFCDKNNYDVKEYVCNKDNIPEITDAIHKKVPFLMRALVTKKFIIEMLEKHQDWIVNKVKDLTSIEESKKKAKVK